MIRTHDPGAVATLPLFALARAGPEKNAAPLAGGAGVGGNAFNEHRTPHRPPVRRNARDTSREAAERVAGRSATLRAQVLAHLRACGAHGATDQEMQGALALHSDTQVPRRWELVRAGAVVASGARRRTRSGCSAIVWIAREHAHGAAGRGEP